jgi:hypothetical protein
MDTIQVEMGMMKKEKPNTQLFFNNTIARVVFEADEERKVYWLNCKDLYYNPDLYYNNPNPNLHRYLSRYHYIGRFVFLYHPHYHLHLPIEEWRLENNFPSITSDWNEEIWTEFKLRWL